MLQDLAKSLKGWRRYITKEASADSFDNYIKHCHQLLTFKDVSQITTTLPAAKGRKALTQAKTSASDDLSLTQFCAARDLLLVSITRSVNTLRGVGSSNSEDVQGRQMGEEEA